ncbi:hypothetical protein GCM10007886_27520 [Methylobacterium gregans]|uniref:DUF5666 domain-containing protein n=1 Tax=Methylobacterium gregans TaxID=374424 RepID=A0AA37M9X6_9HYPH|nr:DUF5666 domain-containing protein [Methylobacterium gregans]MDQ0521405.1 hypothetical protein [Methylobacterium gregans]GJD78075.1 hypothetical protein NBEOAGPD_1287 [Methylobacterium gregans]GLS54569.1 hypothetical protein GCM10007886_27520 [Methylobacterium gregans]
MARDVRPSLRPSRRHVLGLLAGAAFLPGRAPAQEAPIRDQGIGGTGARPTDTPGEGDRGIGGTGVIGTIRRFGSIVVNDLRIAYPDDVAVRIDGAPARASDLRVGHVVRVVARSEGTGLATRRIDVTSEVVGPVEAVGRDSLTVLGQRVATGGAVGPRQGESWTVGQRVAVSGLRRPDGVVVASLIEPRTAGPDRVAGPVRRGPDGALRIGGLRLTGAEHLPVGRRAALAGQARDGSLAVADAAETGLPPGIRTASIEAYIGRRKGGMILGSGLTVAGVPGANLPRSGAVRAVLTTEVAGDGRLTVERLRVDDRLAPVREPPREPGRFEGPGFQRDRLDLRGLPGHGPGGDVTGRYGPGPAQGLRIDTRPPGGGPGGPGGFGPPGGFGGPGGPGLGLGGNPGGFGGPGGPGGGPGGGGPGFGGNPGGFGGGRR